MQNRSANYESPDLIQTPQNKFGIKLAWMKRASAGEVVLIQEDFRDFARPHFFTRLAEKYDDEALMEFGLNSEQIERMKKAGDLNAPRRIGTLLCTHHIQPCAISAPKEDIRDEELNSYRDHNGDDVAPYSKPLDERVFQKIQRWLGKVNSYNNLLLTTYLNELVNHRMIEAMNPGWATHWPGQWKMVALPMPYPKVLVKETPLDIWKDQQNAVRDFIAAGGVAFERIPAVPQEAFLQIFGKIENIDPNILKEVRDASTSFISQKRVIPVRQIPKIFIKVGHGDMAKDYFNYLKRSIGVIGNAMSVILGRSLPDEVMQKWVEDPALNKNLPDEVQEWAKSKGKAGRIMPSTNGIQGSSKKTPQGQGRV